MWFYHFIAFVTMLRTLHASIIEANGATERTIVDILITISFCSLLIPRLFPKQAGLPKPHFPPLFECGARHAFKSCLMLTFLSVQFQREAWTSPKSFQTLALHLQPMPESYLTDSALSQDNLLPPKAYKHKTYYGPSFEPITPLFQPFIRLALPPKPTSQPDNCSLSLSHFTSGDCSTSPPISSYFQLSKTVKRRNSYSDSVANVPTRSYCTTRIAPFHNIPTVGFPLILTQNHLTVDLPLTSAIVAPPDCPAVHFLLRTGTPLPPSTTSGTYNDALIPSPLTLCLTASAGTEHTKNASHVDVSVLP
jgi:hypothetical protein